MTKWVEVLDAREREKQLSAALQCHDITQLYPDLHAKDGLAGKFVVPYGNQVMPDLLTSAHLLVEIEPVAEENVTKTYGIDLDTLHALVDAKLITLSVNRDLSEYRPFEWSHTFIADRRTLHRTVRTARYFGGLSSDFSEARADLAKRLERKFAKLSKREFKAYTDHVVHFIAPTPASVASHLSWIWSRMNALAPSEPGSEQYSIDDLINQPARWGAPFMRDYLLILGPVSGAVGGYVRYPDTFIRTLFRDDPVAKENEAVKAMPPEMVAMESVNEYLMEVLRLYRDDLADSFWRSDRTDKRTWLIELLKDNAERRSIMAAESNLKERFLRSTTAVTKDEIADHVSRDRALFKQVAPLVEHGVNGGGPVLGALAGGIFGLAGVALGAAAGGMLVKAPLVRSATIDIVGAVMPRLQVTTAIARLEKRRR